VVLAVQALFVLSYVGALHHPKPHDVAFGVVGNSRLPAAVGKQFSLKVRQYPDEAAARSAIDHRRIDGAFVADSGGGALLVVPAASNAGATALGTRSGGGRRAATEADGRPGAHAADRRRERECLLPRRHGADPRRISRVDDRHGLRRIRPRRGRLASLALASGSEALLTDVFAGPVLDAVPTSKFLALWGLFVLVMTAVAYATAASKQCSGRGTLIVVGSSSSSARPSGGTVPSAYLPGLWRTFGPYLPAGAGTTAVRNTLYFDGEAITKSLLILSGYLVAGALVVIVVRRRASGTTAEAEAEASTAAAAIVV
jgi:hypothetical protein